MIIKRFISLALAGCVGLSVQAEDADETWRGHDYPRKKTREAAQASFVELEKTITNLLREIKFANGSDEPAPENWDMAQMLEQEHNAWASYRDSHCQMETNIYVYPQGSMLFSHELNSCLLRFNRKRQTYLEGLANEFHQ